MCSIHDVFLFHYPRQLLPRWCLSLTLSLSLLQLVILYTNITLTPPVMISSNSNTTIISLPTNLHVRMKLFNTLLSEVMFKQREDMMDIENMLSRMNDSLLHISCSNTEQQRHLSLTTSSSNKPFTLLEIKPYLQILHDSGHIFLVEDEGRHGVVYAI